MIVFINNEQHIISESISIPDILIQLNINAIRGTAVAVNNHVVPRSEWERFFLNENDKITIIKATQGG